MKVLIETITSRKGYKFFENCEEMDAYLGRHCGKIASYRCYFLYYKFLAYLLLLFLTLISVSFPHKNIYREKLADFGLNKNENDLLLRLLLL